MYLRTSFSSFFKNYFKEHFTNYSSIFTLMAIAAAIITIGVIVLLVVNAVFFDEQVAKVPLGLYIGAFLASSTLILLIILKQARESYNLYFWYLKKREIDQRVDHEIRAVLKDFAKSISKGRKPKKQALELAKHLRTLMLLNATRQDFARVENMINKELGKEHWPSRRQIGNSGFYVSFIGGDFKGCNPTQIEVHWQDNNQKLSDIVTFDLS